MEREIEVDFNPNLFNNVYWHLERAHADQKIRYIWLFGGSSASKTYSEVQLTIRNMLSSTDYNVMVMRKYAVDIRDSIYSDFKSIIEEWQLTDYFITQQNYIRCISGSYVRFRGLDDSEKVKGLAGFKKIILEEVSQFTEEDLKQVKKRLRGRKLQQVIGIFNPISEDHWIKMQIFDKDEWQEKKTDIAGYYINKKGNSIQLKTNYKDNIYIVGKWDGNKLIGGNVDQHVIDDFENDKLTDFGYYLVYALGDWGQIITGGEFYKNFKREKHTAKLIYNPSLPLHISFDENVNPYFPCGIFQIEDKKLMLIDLVLGRNPNNTVNWVTRQIRSKYHTHTSGMFIYGDATSQKEDVKLEKGYDLYRLIMEALRDFHPSRRVSASNPSVIMRGNFFNTILATNYGGIEFVIDDRCAEAITDFYRTKEASDGKKDKTTIKDPKTQISYQPYGHITDLTDYILCYAFSSIYIDFQRGGKQFKPISGRRTSTKGY